MTERNYDEQVARGVALLDEKRPGWVDEIDLDRLNIASPSFCVTAQLSGCHSYLAGREQLGIHDTTGYVAHGFDVTSGLLNGDYDILNAAWRAVILERRGEAA